MTFLAGSYFGWIVRRLYHQVEDSGLWSDFYLCEDLRAEAAAWRLPRCVVAGNSGQERGTGRNIDERQYNHACSVAATGSGRTSRLGWAVTLTEMLRESPQI